MFFAELYNIFDTQSFSWEDVTLLCEKQIINFPLKINDFRTEGAWDPFDAYCMVRESTLLKREYDVIEQIVSSDSVFSEEGMNMLISSIEGICQHTYRIALYIHASPTHS